MKKLFEHAPIYFLYIVGSTYLGLLAVVILNIPLKFVTNDENVRNLMWSLLMQVGCCIALFFLFRAAGNKYAKGNDVRLKEELPSMILASSVNLIFHFALCKTLPGALTAVYFVNSVGNENAGENLGLIFLVLLVCAVLNVVFAALGYVSGAKARIRERASLTGGKSEN